MRIVSPGKLSDVRHGQPTIYRLYNSIDILYKTWLLSHLRLPRCPLHHDQSLKEFMMPCETRRTPPACRPNTKHLHSALVRLALLAASLMGVLALCAGCVTVAKVPIPQDTTPPELKHDLTLKETSPIGFEKLVSGIKRGEVIGAFHTGYSPDGDICNHQSGAVLTWAQGNQQLAGRDDDIANVFYQTMTDLGYTTVGNPAVIFNQSQERNKARYLVGGRVRDIQTNICNESSLWDGHNLHTASGEMYMEIEWTLYDAQLREPVYTTKTKGHAIRENGVYDGFFLLYSEAVEDAIYDLGNDEGFYRKVTGNKDLPSVSAEKLPVCLNDKSPGSFKKMTGEISNSVVTIINGQAHGSGFAISRDGYIMTNAHVVGDSEEVGVMIAKDLTLPGKVVAKNKYMDVAVIKTMATFPPVAIDRDGVKLADSLFAVGTPLDLGFSKTVTQGMVSGFRKMDTEDRNLIQGDMDIQPGNSGGPAFNADGEVVGISTMIYSNTGTSIGIALFIPIEEALQAVGITNTCN